MEENVKKEYIYLYVCKTDLPYYTPETNTTL